MAAPNQEKPKKSFEFRMSKKVAELTQVVHMLFTRNHEKEVEIDALKKAYEKEIESAIEDARGRISKLEQVIEDQKNQNILTLNQEMKKKDEEIKTRETEWQKRLSEGERLLQEERGENQNLRDLLINAQGDIEKLRQGVTDELSSKSDEIQRRDEEVERLLNELSLVDLEMKKAKTDAQEIIKELQKSNARLEDDVHKLQNAMDNAHKARDQLLNRNKHLEHDMSALKREFNKKVAEMANNQIKNAKNNMSSETNLELERLRREVQRYRLELSNRDSSFNRMFTEKQPMLVNQRNSNKQPNSAIYTSFNQGSHSSHQTSSQSQSHPFGSANSNLLSQGVSNSLKDRKGSRTSALLDIERNNSERFRIDKQSNMSERVSSSDRFLQNGHSGKEAWDNRPQTHANSFVHERLVGNAKDRLKQQHRSDLYVDEPNLQQRPGTNSQERPSSSSLPSICSTPERRQPLVKPKPLPRELLYGK